MAFSPNEIKGQLAFGGARPTLFNVQITNPANSVADIKVPFLVEAAQIPEAILGTIEVPYYGRRIKLAGDRTFNPWTVTVINDEDFLIRNAMEEWSNRINSFAGNVNTFGGAVPAEYKSRAIVNQLAKNQATIRTYTFEGLFPIDISPIDLNWGATDEIERFMVTFQYDYWTVEGITGNAGG